MNKTAFRIFCGISVGIFSLLLSMTPRIEGSPEKLEPASEITTYSSQVYFEENAGQFDDPIIFQSQVFQSQVRFLEKGISYAMVREIPQEKAIAKSGKIRGREKYRENIGYLGEDEAGYEALVWNTEFVNVSPEMKVSGHYTTPGNIHYIKEEGKSLSTKRFQELWYKNMYTGIDLKYYGTPNNRIKYDLIVHPHSDLNQVQLHYEGVDSLSIDEKGNLVIQTAWEQVIEASPYSYQEVMGVKFEIHVAYKLLDDHTLGFEILEPYRKDVPLIIDPLLLNWCTYVHSSTSDDYMMSVTLDDAGNVYTTGYTKSFDFPATPGVYQATYHGGLDSYVIKMNHDGSELIYATYIGGSDWELTYGIALGENDEIFVSGFTRSNDFPVSASAFQKEIGGGYIDGFVSKLSQDGSQLMYSTYLGGSDRDYIYDMAVNARGEAYLTGYSLSDDFPTTDQALQTNHKGNGDVYVCRLSSDGSSLLYNTFIGGSNYEIGQSILVNTENEAIVGGSSSSPDLPISPQAYQKNLQQEAGFLIEDGFLLEVNATGTALNFATYMGGKDSDGIYSLDLDDEGNIYVGGTTHSTDFPTSAHAYMENWGQSSLGNGEGFVAKFNPDASQLIYSTFIGGNEIDFVKSIQVDDFGQVYAVGATRSPNFPSTPDQTSHNNMYDLFAAVFNDDATELLNATCLGGSYNEYPRAARSLFLRDNTLTIASTTHSGDLPIPGGAYQNAKTNGASDSPLLFSFVLSDILPLSLQYLSAKWNNEDKAVELAWQSWHEWQGLVYEVERSKDAESWEVIDYVYAKGNSDQLANYTLSDQAIENITGTRTYYRLKYRSPQGDFQYTHAVSLAIPYFESFLFTFFPNPASDILSLEIQLPQNDQSSVDVLDLNGKQVMAPILIEENVPVFRKQVDISSLSPGIYLLHLNTKSDRSIIKKLVVK